MIKKLMHLFYHNKSYSQNGEDIIIDEFFNIKHGIYLDIGAHHPVRFSNTFLLYKKGWTGINIEPNKINFKLFKIFRKKDINLNEYILPESKEDIFYEFKDSALNGFLSKDRLLYLEKLGIFYNKKYKINGKKINNVLKENNILKFDFLNIDIEGLDFEILNSLDLKLFKPRLILIEKNENKILTNKYLLANYELFFENKRNLFFKHK